MRKRVVDLAQIECVKVDSVEFDSMQDVYNLEVEDNENYFANDILIHNCIDGLRYALESYWLKNTNINKNNVSITGVLGW